MNLTVVVLAWPWYGPVLYQTDRNVVMSILELHWCCLWVSHIFLSWPHVVPELAPCYPCVFSSVGPELDSCFPELALCFPWVVPEFAPCWHCCIPVLYQAHRSILMGFKGQMEADAVILCKSSTGTENTGSGGNILVQSHLLLLPLLLLTASS